VTAKFLSGKTVTRYEAVAVNCSSSMRMICPTTNRPCPRPEHLRRRRLLPARLADDDTTDDDTDDDADDDDGDDDDRRMMTTMTM
jgi:hypothetical protein